MADCVVCGSLQRHLFDYRNFEYLRCPSCGLVSTDPIPDEPTIKRHYASKFQCGNYQLLREFKNRYRIIYEDMADVIQRVRGDLRGLRVLDVGCFTGDFLEVMASRGCDVYGVELQDDAVAEANRKFPGHVFKVDVAATEFPDQRFDVITLLAVVEHVIDPERLLRGAIDRLKPGGLVVIETPNSGSLMARIMRRQWPPYAPVEHIHLFTERALRIVLDRAGVRSSRRRRHWKRLPLSYVFPMLESFSPGLRRVVTPLYRILPRRIRELALPLYIGEMIVLGSK